jgi:hypothetical protein
LDGLSNPITLFKLQNIACDYRDFHLMPPAHHAISEGKLESCVFYLVLLEKEQQLIHNLKKIKTAKETIKE